jgi:tight adherence protein C
VGGGQESATATLIGAAAILAGLSLALLWAGVSNMLPTLSWMEVRPGAWLRKLGALNQSLVRSGSSSKLRQRLVMAGEPYGLAPQDIFALQELGFAAGLFAGALGCASIGLGWEWSVVLAALGALYPRLWLKGQVQRRQFKISRALPYHVDLLTLSVEAGLDFVGALGKLVERGRPGPLQEELELVLKELKMGKTREEALKAMSARVSLPPLSTLLTALIQADKMGSSLGRILRSQSSQMRNDRTQRAEKLANQAPVKMLFPLIGCIFPTVFLVLFGPIVFAFIFGENGP